MLDDPGPLIQRGRVAAEKRMLTELRFEYKVGTTPDLATDADVPVYEVAFETKGRIKSPGNVVRETEVGGRTAAETSRVLNIPVDSPDPWSDPRSAHGVTALITAVHPTDDQSLLGIRVRLSGPAPGSQTTARRLQITETVT
jgi:hypothetical protein